MNEFDELLGALDMTGDADAVVMCELLKKCRISFGKDSDMTKFSNAQPCVVRVVDKLIRLDESDHQVNIEALKFLCNFVAKNEKMDEHNIKIFLKFCNTNWSHVETISMRSALLFQCARKSEEFRDKICLNLIESNQVSEFIVGVAQVWLNNENDKFQYLEWNLFLLENLFISPHFGLILNEMTSENQLKLFHCLHSVKHGSVSFFESIIREFSITWNFLKNSYSIVSSKFQCFEALLELLADAASQQQSTVEQIEGSEALFDICLEMLEFSKILPNISIEANHDFDSSDAGHNFKCRIVELIAGLVQHSSVNKAKLMNQEGALLALVDLMRRVDLSNPFAAQWVVLAIRNACEGSPEMAETLLKLMSGSDFLAKLGIKLPQVNQQTEVKVDLPREKNEVVEYSKTDFVYCDQVESGKKTWFGDKFSTEFFKLVEQEGVMKFRCKNVPNKFIESDRRKYPVLYIEGRATKRRQADHFEKVSQSPDKNAFNFSKCNRKEILFAMKCRDDVESYIGTCFGAKESPDDEKNVLMLNVSPIGEPSCLLVPDRLKVLRQVITPGSVRLALHSMLLFGDRYIRIGFNSMCSFASVNHLHFHLWSVPYSLFSESTPCSKITPMLFESTVPESGPVPGFAVDLDSLAGDVDKFAQLIYLLCDSLVIDDIPYNMFLTWGRRLRDNEGTSLRCFIHPKRKITETDKDKPLCAAVGELAGYLIVKDFKVFEEVTVELWEREAAEQSKLNPGQFDIIRKRFEHIALDMF